MPLEQPPHRHVFLSRYHRDVAVPEPEEALESSRAVAIDIVPMAALLERLDALDFLAAHGLGWTDIPRP